MMLRSRKNASNIDIVKENVGLLKRHAAAIKDEPKRRRGGLSDLSNVITNTLCIDSSKKVIEKPASKAVLKCRNTNLSSIDENGEEKHVNTLVKKTVLKERVSPIHENVKEKDEVLKVSQSVQVSEVDPCPGYDYDAGNAGDPILVSEYAFDIFKYYKYRESAFVIEDYAIRQHKFTKEMRAVLADWMVEIQESFELNHETLYTAIKIMDHYLNNSKTQIQKQDLQLMGSTAIFIASKFEERSPPPIEEFLYVCGGAFTHEQMLSMERCMLRTIGFDLGYPLAYRFLRRYSRVLQLDMPTLTLARYYLETCALYYEFVGTSDSLMASACLLLALRVKNLCDWNPILIKYSGYHLEEVEPLMWAINHAMIMRPHIYPRLVVSFDKYSSEVFYEVARFSFLEDKFNQSDPVEPPPGLSFKKMN